jgi:hypothetical protein
MGVGIGKKYEWWEKEKFKNGCCLNQCADAPNWRF